MLASMTVLIKNQGQAKRWAHANRDFCLLKAGNPQREVFERTWNTLWNMNSFAYPCSFWLPLYTFCVNQVSMDATKPAFRQPLLLCKVMTTDEVWISRQLLLALALAGWHFCLLFVWHYAINKNSIATRVVLYHKGHRWYNVAPSRLRVKSGTSTK